MLFQITEITEEDGWIAIASNGNAAAPVRCLADAYQKKINGKLVKPYDDDEQYIVKGDPYKLVFQYDDMFGNIVILNDLADKDKVVELLNTLFIECKDL